MPDRNAVGDRGESIFHSRITEHYMFNVYFLGEKAPIVDFLLEIRDEKKPYYCIVQVKSTEQGYDAMGIVFQRHSHQPYIKGLYLHMWQVLIYQQKQFIYAQHLETKLMLEVSPGKIV